MKVLFDSSGKPHPSTYVSSCVAKREPNFAKAIQEITQSAEDSIDIHIFSRNAARLLVSSKMTRRGAFQGLRFVSGKIHDPNAILDKVWDAVGKPIVELKGLLVDTGCKKRSRMLIETPGPVMDKIAADLWSIFKKLLPVCMGVNNLGLTAASKILFSAFPEIALPVEKAQWTKLFQTVDYSDIIGTMRMEVVEWENSIRNKLDECDPHSFTTLPVCYNAVALRVAGGETSNGVD